MFPLLPSTLVTLVLLTVTPTSAQIYNTQCYSKSDNVTRESPLSGPCGVVQPGAEQFLSCCHQNDTCLSDGLCLSSQPLSASSSSSNYYIGGCTDSSLSSSSCSHACNDLAFPDITYNVSKKAWQCCGSVDGVAHCDTPTSEIFTAPAPTALSTIYTVPTQVVVANTTPTTNETTASPLPSSPPPPHKKGLSTGIIIAIAIPGALVLSLLIAVIGRSCRRAQRRRHQELKLRIADAEQRIAGSMDGRSRSASGSERSSRKGSRYAKSLATVAEDAEMAEVGSGSGMGKGKGKSERNGIGGDGQEGGDLEEGRPVEVAESSEKRRSGKQSEMRISIRSSPLIEIPLP